MRTSRLRTLTSRAALFLGAAGALYSAEALACGCFAPPPAVPVIQAGERILFIEDNGVVTAHIQVQYSGQGEFGWLLPLPSIPKDSTGKDGIDLGIDELFTQLLNTTQPKYILTRKYDSCGNSRDFAGGTANMGGPPQAAPGGKDAGGPVVLQENVGPYDVAILDASNKQEMIDWLLKQGKYTGRPGAKFVVPAGTDNAVGTYVHPGAYFLALALHPGNSAGDIQPVVLRYKSDLPMIPIVLTSVGATQNMGVQVWMLGQGRAIPRNYYHTVINDSQIDWFNFGKNYNDVIIKAVGEAAGKHSFVTEFAGNSQIMRNQLDPPGRFNNLDQLGQTKDPVAFVKLLFQSGFAPVQQSTGRGGPGFAQPVLSSQVANLLSKYIPLPAALAKTGVTLAQFYSQIETLLPPHRNDMDVQATLDAFDPAKLMDELTLRYVGPLAASEKLFGDYPYLTRLYTTISPLDMNKDPVFSYNPSLPDYNNVHNATLTYHCNGGYFSSGRYSSATLQTEQGWEIGYSVEDADANKFALPGGLPFSQRIETLAETGGPTVVVDNTGTIRSHFSSGCSAAGPGSPVSYGALLLLLGSAALLRRRRQELPSR